MFKKPFGELQVSFLGMGNMRLPTVGSRGPIDEAKAREIVEYAYENGVNYYDTAFRYHEGESETFIGKVLNQYPRDTWYLATKFPGHMLREENGKFIFTGFGQAREEVFNSIEEIFQSQLDRCGVDYFDFYLLHNLSENSFDFYTNKDIGVIEYLLSEKKAGRIKHLGFSSHGRAETIDNFLSLYKGVFELVQIQLNYLDWTLQDAKSKYEVITKHGIPVVAMEPCRGGRLASLDAKSEELLKAARPEDSIASWAFRYLQELPNMQVVLSGMSTMEQIRENVELFSKPEPVSEDEKALLQKIVDSMVSMVPCTACRYCCEGCPKGLDIPKLIGMYNESRYERSFPVMEALRSMTKEELPEACIACGECSKVCPQNIDVPDVMAKYCDMLAKMPQR